MGKREQAIIVLIGGGFFIFPLTLAGLRIIGHRATVSRDNPLNRLGMQAAFVLPLSLPVVGAAALYRAEWFYPAFMIVLGAHYLPFVTLYGMRLFYALAGLLVSGGLGFALFAPLPPVAAAWSTGAALIAFAVAGRITVQEDLASQVCHTGETATISICDCRPPCVH